MRVAVRGNVWDCVSVCVFVVFVGVVNDWVVYFGVVGVGRCHNGEAIVLYHWFSCGCRRGEEVHACINIAWRPVFGRCVQAL